MVESARAVDEALLGLGGGVNRAEPLGRARCLQPQQRSPSTAWRRSTQAHMDRRVAGLACHRFPDHVPLGARPPQTAPPVCARCY